MTTEIPETINMDVTNVTGGPTEKPPKKGRGPTRDAVRFADMVEAVGKWSDDDRRSLIGCIAENVTAKSVRDRIAADRRALAQYVKTSEAGLRRDERIAETLQTVEGLSPILRAALVRTLEPDAPVA